MKTDEIQGASSAAAGSLSAHVRRLMGATGRWSASVLRLWFGGTGRWSASVFQFGATGRWSASVVQFGGTGRWSASVFQFGATGRWSASVLRWGRSAAVGSSTLNPSHSKWLRWDFGTVRVVLAAVLLVAAALKSEQLWETSPQPFASPTFALIVFEFAFAAWLLTGWLPRVTWWLAVGCFTAFALVASGKLLQGEPDCGCFGAARTTPLFALAVDLAALVCLWFARRDDTGASRQSGRLTLFAVIGFVLLGTYIGYHFRGRGPLISLLESDQQFAPIWVQETVSHPLTFVNHSRAPVRIAELTTSCACSSMDPNSMELAPGERAKVRLKINPLKRFANQEIPLEQPLTLVVTARVDRPIRQWYQWQLHFRVKSLLRAAPTFAHFRSSALGPVVLIDGELCVEAYPGLLRLDAQADSSDVKVEVAQTADTSQFIVHVAAPVSRNQSPRDVELRLLPILSDSSPTSAFETNVRFTRIPVVHSDPPFVSFGAVPVGTLQQQELWLLSTPETEFSITGPIVWTPNVVTQATSVVVDQLPDRSPSSGLRLQVALQSSIQGDCGGTITVPVVHSNDAYVLEIPVAAHLE